MTHHMRPLQIPVILLMFCLACISCADKSELKTVTDTDSGVSVIGAFDKDVILSYQDLSKDKTTLGKVETTLSGKYDATVLVFDLHLSASGVAYTPSGNVIITMKTPTGVTADTLLFHIKNDGNYEELHFTIVNDTMTFTVSSFSTFVLASAPPLVLTWYHDATYHWHMLNNSGITDKAAHAFSASELITVEGIQYDKKTCTICGYVDTKVHADAINYTVTYEGNEATSGVPDPQTQKKGTTITIANAPVRTKYKFTGWKRSDNGKLIQPKVSHTGTENLTLTAQWTYNWYSITYDANGATGTVPDKQENEKRSPLTISPAPDDLKKDGYTFAGWNTKKGGDGTSYAVGKVVYEYENLDLYAVWRQNLASGFYYLTNTSRTQIYIDNGGTSYSGDYDSVSIYHGDTELKSFGEYSRKYYGTGMAITNSELLSYGYYKKGIDDYHWPFRAKHDEPLTVEYGTGQSFWGMTTIGNDYYYLESTNTDEEYAFQLYKNGDRTKDILNGKLKCSAEYNVLEKIIASGNTIMGAYFSPYSDVDVPLVIWQYDTISGTLKTTDLQIKTDFYAFNMCASGDNVFFYAQYLDTPTSDHQTYHLLRFNKSDESTSLIYHHDKNSGSNLSALAALGSDVYTFASSKGSDSIMKNDQVYKDISQEGYSFSNGILTTSGADVYSCFLRIDKSNSKNRDFVQIKNNGDITKLNLSTEKGSIDLIKQLIIVP